MRCPNCGNELPPDTPRCPYCAENEVRVRRNQKERKKIYVTLGFCALALVLILAGFLLFHPGSEFSRSIEQAENCYAVAELCEDYPDEAASQSYHLRLIAAIDEIELHYQEQTCGYAQTVHALEQLSLVKNPVIFDHAIEVWEGIERMRLYQLFNSQRSKNNVPELIWSPEAGDAAVAVAAEYAAVGMDYQNNMERLIQSKLPESVTTAYVSSLLHTAHAQDALTQYQKDPERRDTVNLIASTEYTHIGIGATYDTENHRWSFILIALP